jgi:excisionase family DNA binding protein
VEAATSDLLTPQEAAAYLRVRPSWVYEAARGRRLPHIKVGRHLRFMREDLDAWLAAQRVPSRLSLALGQAPR